MKHKELNELKSKKKDELSKLVTDKKIELLKLTSKIYAGKEKKFEKRKILKKRNCPNLNSY